MNRRAVRRLCELDETIRAMLEGIIAQSKTALAELGRENLAGEKVRPGVSLDEFAHRAGLLAYLARTAGCAPPSGNAGVEGEFGAAREEQGQGIVVKVKRARRS